MPQLKRRPADALALVMSRADAAKLTALIREDANRALENAERAYQQRAWAALGYTTWEDYAHHELHGHFTRAHITALRHAGMSLRAIAATTGTSKDTVRRQVSQSETRNKVTGTDGHRYPATKPAPVIETTAVEEAPIRPLADTEEQIARRIRTTGQGDDTIAALLGVDTVQVEAVRARVYVEEAVETLREWLPLVPECRVLVGELLT